MVLKHQISDSCATLKMSDDTDNNNKATRREDGGGWLEMWRDYSSSSTLHCISRATKAGSSLFRRYRIVWFVFLSAMAGLLFWQSSIQISRYLRLDTLLKVHSQEDENMQFPLFTICDINQVKRSDVQDPQIQQVLSKTYMENEKDISYFSSLDVNWLKSIDVYSIFYNRSHTVFDMFLMCLWENKPVECSSIFTSRVTSAGVCATLVDVGLSVNGGIGIDMGVTVILQSNISDYLVTSTHGSGFRVLFHTSDEEPDVNGRGMMLSMGTANTISVRVQKTSFLKHPIPAFGDDFCIDTLASDFVSTLKYTSKYSFGACRLDCHTSYVVDMCGCKDVFMPVSFARNGSCDCSQPCDMVSFDTTLSQGSFPHPGYIEATFPNLNVSTNYLRENGLMLEVFLENKMFIKREQILEFTEADLVASIGGYMGLFIGASVGTIMELLELFVDFILKLFKKLKIFQDRNT